MDGDVVIPMKQLSPPPRRRRRPDQISRSKHASDLERQAEDLIAHFDKYATSKSNSQNLLNLSLLLSLVNTIVTTFNTYGTDIPGIKVALIVFVIISISLQIGMFIMLVCVAKSDTEEMGRCCGTMCTTIKVNTWIMIFSGILPIISGTIAIISAVSMAAT